VKLLAQLARNSALELILIVLARSDPRERDGGRLARATYQKMVQNLWWATRLCVGRCGGLIEEVCYYLDASVFSAAGGAFLLAGYAEYPFGR